jgi:hypothetical protein
MADATIVPPSAQIQTVAPAGGQPSQAAQHPNLPQGALVSGTIAGRDVNGNYVLKSQQGTFTLQSSTPLTYNSDVTIRIGASVAGNTSARIVSVNGEPFSEFSAPEVQGSDTVSSALLTQAPETATDAAPTQASGVRAVIVSAPAPAAGSPANANLTPGSTVILRASYAPSAGTVEQPQTQGTDTSIPSTSITSSATAAVEPEQVAQSAQPPALLQSAIPAPQPQAVTPAGTPATVATANPVETELAPAQAVTQTTQSQAPADQPSAAQQPSSPAPAPALSLYSAYTKQSSGAPAPAAAPGTPAFPAPASSGSGTQAIPAQVVSTEENGTLNLQTPLGSVTVQAPNAPSLSALPPGTALTLELIATEPMQSALTAAPASVNELAASWQSLKDIVGLAGTNDATASAALLARLPELGPAFVSQSTAFISALIQGEARKLLGDDTVDALRQNGQSDLLEKFSGEVDSLSASYNAPAARQTASWQTLFLPFVFQEALQQARIYVKREPPKKERAGKATADTRFVIEVDLSEMGALQMDGLVRGKEKAIAFDLVIRSHNPFSPADQSEILAIYNSAAELTGFKGSLAFQVTRDFPVKPLEDISGEEGRSITV